MNTTLRIAILIFSLFYLFLIIKNVKKGKLQLAFSLLWMLIGIFLIFAACFPNVINVLAVYLGFELTSNMVFFITIFLAFFLMFDLTIRLSKESRKNITLVQELSILKARIDKLEEEK